MRRPVPDSFKGEAFHFLGKIAPRIENPQALPAAGKLKRRSCKPSSITFNVGAPTFLTDTRRRTSDHPAPTTGNPSGSHP
jgi:hypothetical protein